MKRIPAIIGLLLIAAAGWAQPSWTKKATKSVFTLKTFDVDGGLLASSNGFFTGTEGEAVSSFSPFRGAHKAVVIDSQGKEFTVLYMLGANDTYDVAKFRVDSRKTTPLVIASTNATEEQALWLLPYRETKNIVQGSVKKAEVFNGNDAYYTLALTMSENATGCPILNEQGEVVGLAQQPARQNDTLTYAVSARYADSLHISGLSLNDAALRNTHIKKDLPADLNQAQLTMFMAANALDSLSYAQLIDDFIAKFPEAPDGYTYRAQLLGSARRFNEAARSMEQAIKVADKKDEAHFNYAKLIYQKEIYMADIPFEGWSLDKALEEAREAERINAQAVYRHQQAVILYAQKKYDDAYERYTTIFNSELRSPDLFFEASRCKLQLADTTAVLALLDSCVNMFNKPYLREAAPYIYARGQARMDAGRFRDATADFLEYERVMPNSVDDRFFYMRFRAEVGGRQFQQALNDIEEAIRRSPKSDLYLSEKASLLVRVGHYDQAMETARECIKIAPDHSDGYLFLGLAQCLKGQKEEGIQNLHRAKELGDDQADTLINQYGK